MESVCLRIKTTFFSRWLALPPAVPDIEVKTTSDTVTTRFVYTQPTPFNQWDEIEFQVFPAESKVLEILGEHADWVTFYRGRERRFVLDKLPAERSFRIRARACNSKGSSEWCREQLVRTRQRPLLCGGTGPGYTWDQLPEQVEVKLEVPPETKTKEVTVVVMPRRIKVVAGKKVLLEGPLGGEAKGSEIGDYEWEIVESGGKKHLHLTLQKRDQKQYRPDMQWDCLVEGPEHPKARVSFPIDLALLRWERRDRPWRPVQEATNLDEVSKALPDMNIADKPLRYETGPTEDLTNWGEQWKRRQAEAEKKSSSG